MAAEEWGQVDVIQPPYSMVNRRDEKLMKWAYDKGINTLTYGSLGSGILTGAFREIPNLKMNGISAIPSTISLKSPSSLKLWSC